MNIMRNYHKHYTVVQASFAFLLCVATLASCTKKYEEYNTNPYLATLEQQLADGFLVGRNFPDMVNAVMPAGDPAGQTNFINSYQLAYSLAADCYAGYMGQANNWNGNTNNLTYGFNLGWVNEQFRLTGVLMAGWTRIKQATDLSGDSLQFSVAQIIKITGMLRVTDSYGPLPYSQIPTGTFTPAFDSQESIYRTSIAELGRAADILHELGANAGTPLAAYDQIYVGNYVLWAKYANSLKLRLAMRMAYVDPANAQRFAEEAVSHPAGLLMTITDAAL
ncbi:hypothetical protein DI53_3209 [Sphingobacterium deserti]|uniref:SusD/RagB family nutrient-binding outer membrane lipoprotein n=1 Tax=Sphingobacterium deserti TaxID=1229276 RepID=A0A0B8SZ82_9SPHI|nr:hypothetical protein DI53_3209 [Sphingobacterium deserti]